MLLNFLLLSILIFTTAGALGIKPAILFASTAIKPIPEIILQQISSSQISLNLASNYFFAVGDQNHNGNLEPQEFQNIYATLFSFLYDIQVSQAFIDNSFILAQVMTRDNTLNQNEFFFLTSINLAFLSNNIELLRGNNTDMLVAAVNNIETYFAQRQLILPLLFKQTLVDGENLISLEDFKFGFTLLSKRLGFDISFTDAILNDFFEVIDTNQKGGVSELQTDVLLYGILTNIQSLLNSLLL